MGQLKKIESKLNMIGFQLVGVSTHSTDDLKKSMEEHQFSYQLLSDYHSTLSTAFGLSFFASEKQLGVMSQK